MRYIGVDLHTTQITVCYWQAESPQEIFQVYPLAQMAEFVAGLQPTDALAVEATGNTRWFVGQVKESVREVILVNPREFEVIKKSVKKTDKNDARNLARFLQAGLLPEVREKSEQAERVASLNETRNKLVRLKTSFLNKIHALAVAQVEERVVGQRSGFGAGLGAGMERGGVSRWKSSWRRCVTCGKVSSGWTRCWRRRRRNCRAIGIWCA
jgi:transposase